MVLFVAENLHVTSLGHLVEREPEEKQLVVVEWEPEVERVMLVDWVMVVERVSVVERVLKVELMLEVEQVSDVEREPHLDSIQTIILYRCLVPEFLPPAQKLAQEGLAFLHQHHVPVAAVSRHLLLLPAVPLWIHLPRHFLE